MSGNLKSGHHMYQKMFYIVLFYVLVSHCSEVWMCAEASHTSNKVEFYIIYLFGRIMDLYWHSFLDNKTDYDSVFYEVLGSCHFQEPQPSTFNSMGNNPRYLKRKKAYNRCFIVNQCILCFTDN